MLSRVATSSLRRGCTGHTFPSVSRAQLARFAQRRGYASHGSSSSGGSDMTWMIGSATVTVAGAAFLLSPGTPNPHSQSNKHGEQHPVEAPETTQAEEDDVKEDKDDSKGDEKSDSKSDKSGDEASSEDSDDESEGVVTPSSKSSKGTVTPDDDSVKDPESPVNHDQDEKKETEEKLRKTTVKRDPTPKKVGPEGDQIDGAHKN